MLEYNDAFDNETFSDLSGFPRHQAALAAIAATYAAIEYQLCQLFAWSLHCPPPHAAGAYYRLVNNKARIDMLRGSITWLHTETERKTVRAVIEKATAAADIRNRYCHALWSVQGGVPYLLANLDTIYPRGNRRPVTAEAIEADAKKVREAHTYVAKAIMSLSDSRPLQVPMDALKPSFAPKYRARLHGHGR